MANDYQIRESYKDFLLGYQWDLYSTITYKSPRYDGIQWARRAFETFEKFDCTRMFVAVEPHALEGIHLHCLSRHLHSPLRDGIGNGIPPGLWKYCFKAYGRTKIEPVKSAIQVTRYCAKYVVKGNQYEFFGEPEAWKLDNL